MPKAYAIGHITVKDEAAWVQYRSQVPGTLTAWGGDLVFRGKQLTALSGHNPHPDIVVIAFPNVEALKGWFNSAEYQRLVPLRQQAADVDLLAYEA